LLGKLPLDAVRREVRDSKAALEELAGRPVTAFCMPGGSYNRAVLDEIFGAGYEVVLTSEVGTVSPQQRVLKRCGIFSKQNPDWFVDQVHGPVHELVEVAQRARAACERLWGRLWTRSSA
jgi:peptidoglycan/xylan/chitin deacetylase (PgdA/CDA1 family)